VSSRGVKRSHPNRASGRWSRAWLALYLFCLCSESAGLFTGCSSPRPDRAVGPLAFSGNKAVCWILLDFDSFFCSACLAPLLEFCGSLPVPIQEERVRGILVYSARPDREQGGRYAQIIQKKISGFVKANNLQFPIVLDGFHVFNGLVESSARILLFDDGTQSVKAYALPLKPGERDEIKQLLLH
jgi:hypothetical protein